MSGRSVMYRLRCDEAAVHSKKSTAASRPEAGHLTVKGVFAITVAPSYLAYQHKKFQGLNCLKAVTQSKP